MAVCTITDDERLFDVPKLRIACLRVTDAARARILKVLTSSSFSPATSSAACTVTLYLVQRADGTGTCGLTACHIAQYAVCVLQICGPHEMSSTISPHGDTDISTV